MGVSHNGDKDRDVDLSHTPCGHSLLSRAQLGIWLLLSLQEGAAEWWPCTGTRVSCLALQHGIVHPLPLAPCLLVQGAGQGLCLQLKVSLFPWVSKLFPACGKCVWPQTLLHNFFEAVIFVLWSYACF